VDRLRFEFGIIGQTSHIAFATFDLKKPLAHFLQTIVPAPGSFGSYPKVHLQAISEVGRDPGGNAIPSSQISGTTAVPGSASGVTPTPGFAACVSETTSVDSKFATLLWASASVANLIVYSRFTEFDCKRRLLGNGGRATSMSPTGTPVAFEIACLKVINKLSNSSSVGFAGKAKA
jgi:hypothetical protein